MGVPGGRAAAWGLGPRCARRRQLLQCQAQCQERSLHTDMLAAVCQPSPERDHTAALCMVRESLGAAGRPGVQPLAARVYTAARIWCRACHAFTRM